jgi:gas vesicle protein
LYIYIKALIRKVFGIDDTIYQGSKLEDVTVVGKRKNYDKLAKEKREKYNKLAEERYGKKDANKIANSSSDYSSALAKVLNKVDDKVSQKIKNFENAIKKLDFEDGFLVNNAKKLELKHSGKKYQSKIDWSNNSLDQFVGSTITHNHPNGSGLSLADVQMFLYQELREIRAVCKDGTVYSMKHTKTTDDIRINLKTSLESIEKEMKQFQKSI